MAKTEDEKILDKAVKSPEKLTKRENQVTRRIRQRLGRIRKLEVKMEVRELTVAEETQYDHLKEIQGKGELYKSHRPDDRIEEAG